MASFFWIHAGANNNWATNGNWSATSGGGSNAAQPSVTSDVTFDGAGANGNDASTVSATQSVLSLTFTTGYTNTVTLNAQLTVAGNFTDRTQHTWAGGSDFVISATSTITSNGKTFPNIVSFTGSNTKTLVGDWTLSSLLVIVTATTTINKTTAEVLSCGGLTVNNALTGTISITITGGTWSGGSGNTISGTISLAGNVTVSGSSVFFSTGTLKYTSGTITTTSSTLAINGSVTLDTAGVTWNNITFSGTSQTYTINSLMTAGGTILLTGVTTSIFAGTAGFTCDILSCTAAGAFAVTLKNSVTYTVVSSFTANASRSGAIVSFASNDGTLRANLTMQNFSTLCYVISAFTRIDASGGRPLNVLLGTITDSPNVIATPSTTIFYNPPPRLTGSARLPLSNVNRLVQYK